ncbi:extracellular solute-binding protein [Actinomycetospora sp. CA-084318]|uniref:extracellular solute-binding protein n=1 Tax=Actinomycetospora sp. CA-084318 TaxID=3239892 RepID=UPI003D9520A2
MGVPRRVALAALGLGAVGLAGCSAPVWQGFGFDTVRPAADDELLVTLWGTAAERRAFSALAEGFRASTGVPVRLQAVPFSRRGTTVDTGIRAGAPPDVFRVTYNDVGLYRDAGVLAPLPDSAALRPAFGEQFWAAVTGPGSDTAVAVPHHTDTSMLLVDTAAAQAAGLGALPTDPEAAWDWDRFLDACRRLAALRPGRAATAVNWQSDGAYRWLNWVDQAGGRLLTPTLDGAVRPPDDGLRAALDLTRRLFVEGLVPRSTSTSGGVTTDELFSAGTVASAFVGNFSLGDLEGAPAWTAVPLPRAAQASADLGGNALAATVGPRTEQSLAFLRWCVTPENMAAFCSAASALPTRSDVPAASLRYPTAPEAMARYVAQAATVRPPLVEQVTIPRAAAVTAELADGLERAFLGDPTTPTAEYADALAAAVDRAVRR